MDLGTRKRASTTSRKGKRRRLGLSLPTRPLHAGLQRPSQYRVIGAGGSELKFHDVALNDAVVSAAGTITPSINFIPQATTEIGRIGRKCTVVAINWHYTFILPEVDAVGTPAAGDFVRVILYVDKQTNGAAATATDILETDNFLSFRNLANSGRFNVLLDKTVVLDYKTLASDGAGVVSSAAVLRQGSFYKRCNIPLEFSSTGVPVIDDIRSNNLGVLLLSANGVAAFTSSFRLRFVG